MNGNRSKYPLVPPKISIELAFSLSPIVCRGRREREGEKGKRKPLEREGMMDYVRRKTGDKATDKMKLRWERVKRHVIERSASEPTIWRFLLRYAVL